MEIDKNRNGFRGEAEPPKSTALSTAPAAELNQIASDVEAFLALWMVRLESLLDGYGSSSVDDAALRRRTEEFEAAQRRWNEERRRDVEQIQETTEQLAAAWGRLEEEQRRILQSQEGVTERAPEKTSPQPTKPQIAKPQTAKPQTAMPRISSPGPPETASEESLESGDAAAASREHAVRQFQKLRRQIGLPTT